MRNSSSTIAGRAKRGRGPSQRPCYRRNAQMARENRQKTKAYIQKLEKSLKTYKNLIRKLNAVKQQQAAEKKRLTENVAFFKSVSPHDTNIDNFLMDMKHSLQKMINRDEKEDEKPRPAQTNADVANWVISGQAGASKANNASGPLLEYPMKHSADNDTVDNHRTTFAQNCSPPKIARNE